MSRDTDLHNQKKKEILEYYNKLSSETAFGVKKFTIAYCTSATADKFFLKPKTIECYLYR
jgi:hypothetical protein